MKYKDFTNKDLEDLINGFYNGTLSPTKLPIDLYEATIDRLTDAVTRGFGDFDPDDVVLTDLFQNFEHNIGAFSAAKTFQQSLDVSKLLFKDGYKVPFGEFKTGAGEIFDEYNRNWLKTEYRTAYNNALGARQWLDLKENADVAPFLRYDTAGDERVRDEHVPLDGITLHIDHPFWKTNFPPNGWNCRCDVTQYSEDDDIQITPEATLKDLPEPPKLFALNPALDKVIFKEDHPYFLVADRHEVQKINNFGLPVKKAKPKPLAPEPGKQIQRLPFAERLKLVREKLLNAVEVHDKELNDIEAQLDQIKKDGEAAQGADFYDLINKRYSLGPGPERDALISEVERRSAARTEILNRAAPLFEKRQKLRLEHEDRVVNILAQDEPLNVRFKLNPNTKAAKDNFVERGVEAFRRIVGKKDLINSLPDIKFSRRNGRASFTPGAKSSGFGVVSLFDVNSIETVCHKLGHWLEVSNLNILEQNAKFLNRRTYGKSAKKLSLLTGNGRYGSLEIAIEDDFMNPYTGKVYSGATGGHYETLTMWFTHVLGRPADLKNFLLKDPDHFETYLKMFYENL